MPLGGLMPSIPHYSPGKPPFVGFWGCWEVFRGFCGTTWEIGNNVNHVLLIHRRRRAK